MEDYSLKKFFASPFPPYVLPYLLLLFAALGFLDATYLTIQHFAHAIPPCTIGGCETVLTSQYATVLGVPTSLLGALFYGVLLVLGGIYLTMQSVSRSETTKQSDIRLPRFARNDALQTISTYLFVLSSVGLLVGIGLILLQAFVLHAWCYYCLFSELIDFLLFDTSWWTYNGMRKE